MRLRQGLGIAALASAFLAAPPVSADKSQPIAQRKALYAPWNPADMPARRKEQGLIGPGTNAPFPARSFPSYLKKPDTIDKLMPAARAAARQAGGRTPLGLVESGKQHFNHCKVWEWALEHGGWTIEDLIVTRSTSIIKGWNHSNQKHFRKAICFFWVIRKTGEKKTV